MPDMDHQNIHKNQTNDMKESVMIRYHFLLPRYIRQNLKTDIGIHRSDTHNGNQFGRFKTSLRNLLYIFRIKKDAKDITMNA